MSGVDLSKDNRFIEVLKDPKFKKLPKWERKVKIDKRFQSMFKNDSFKVTYSVDKRGRKAPRTTVEDLKKYYDLSSDEESRATDQESDDAESAYDNESDRNEKALSSDTSNSQVPRSNKSDDEVRKKHITPVVRQKLKDMSVDYARGEGRLFSASSSDEIESEESDDEHLYHEWNELDKDAEVTDNITCRLAVCNMDWDRIRAIDLMMMFNSFLPPNSLIRSVVIYPSEFGLRRLTEEEVHGPAELRGDVVENESDSDRDEETAEGKCFQMESMRQYQLKRLKYYYAVATFDKPETADFIYTHCNGVEYESSGVRLDLRFIDDDTTFNQEPKDTCDSTENCDKYGPCIFTNTALQQVKVNSTWDETDPRRSTFAEKITEAAKTKDIDDSDLKDFVALSSSEGEDESVEITFNDDQLQSPTEDCEKREGKIGSIRQYRKLLKEIEEEEKREKERDTELEVMWGVDGVNSREKKASSDENLNEDREIKLKKKTKLRKREEKLDNVVFVSESKNVKERRKNRKKITDEDIKQEKELELLLDEENEVNKHNFNMKKIQEAEKKSKKYKKNEKSDSLETDDFQVDVNDERFEALYSSHLFNLDPTNPKFLKTKGMDAFLLEKRRRMEKKKKMETNTVDELPEKKKKDSDLSFLVKSVRNKTKSVIRNKFNKFR